MKVHPATVGEAQKDRISCDLQHMSTLFENENSRLRSCLKQLLTAKTKPSGACKYAGTQRRTGTNLSELIHNQRLILDKMNKSMCKR